MYKPIFKLSDFLYSFDYFCIESLKIWFSFNKYATYSTV
ncbi:hypothetical protein GPUN_2354 [Glaciecola punicea ACAM 611]|uniref:Uncharacterized protein n=1 Tax=Glaciecola punicea ACAM 611 TaxID=1121923 RepID=H5TDU2_9ALTE|nr:hypothetical protein GPUN_2354 [Glaciecola punicea ACAM 611]